MAGKEPEPGFDSDFVAGLISTLDSNAGGSGCDGSGLGMDNEPESVRLTCGGAGFLANNGLLVFGSGREGGFGSNLGSLC